jgi:anti-sigma B factor antagonist
MISHEGQDLLRVEEATEGLVVVKLRRNQIDESNAEAVGEQLFRLVDELHPPRLQLQLDEVEFMTSVGLGKFIALHKKVAGKGGKLSLSNVNELVYQLFQVTHLHKLLDVRCKAAG